MANFDLNYLKYFYMVVVNQGFTNAAEQLHVQQPVISRAVKLLEEQLGFKLLERQRKQVILTTEGREVFKIAEKIFINANLISSYSIDHQDNTAGELCFSTSDSLAPELMGPVLKQFIHTHPKLKPIHHSGSANMFLDKISSGSIEFGIFFNVPELSRDLEKTKIGNVRFEYVVLGKLANDTKVLNSFIASREQSSNEQSRLPLFEKYKLFQKQVSIIAISSSSIARKSMAMNGIGVTILPHYLVKEELRKGILKPLHEGNYSLPVYLVERSSSYRSKAKIDLLNSIKDMIKD
jgi:DNA-binding transcriptional LysR family regulator